MISRMIITSYFWHQKLVTHTNQICIIFSSDVSREWYGKLFLGSHKLNSDTIGDYFWIAHKIVSDPIENIFIDLT